MSLKKKKKQHLNPSFFFINSSDFLTLMELHSATYNQNSTYHFPVQLFLKSVISPKLRMPHMEKLSYFVLFIFSLPFQRIKWFIA